MLSLNLECLMLIKSSIITFTLQSTSAGPYRRDRHLRGWVRKAMATGYLPLLVLRHKFRAFCASGETSRQIRHHPAVADFIEYMEHTYIGERALFPAATWCVYGWRSDNRSNNAVEGKTFDYSYFCCCYFSVGFASICE